MDGNFKDVIAESPCVFAIGVAGDSGSGKTTFTGAIREIFGADLVSSFSLDDYHRYGRKERNALGITPLAPEANHLDRIARDLADLKRGRPIEKPVYNHRTGTFDSPVPFAPARILILEGLHTLFTPRLRELLDFTLFVDPDEEVKRAWKMKRDTGDRGYRTGDVEGERARRAADYRKYIAPQRQFADAVISAGFSRYGRELGQQRNIYQVTLLQTRPEERIRDIELSIDLSGLLSLSDRDFLMEFRIEELDEREMGALTFDGELPYALIRRLEAAVERQTEVRPIRIYENRSTVTAGEIVQLILAWRIINRRISMEPCRE
ncbi:MAG TPA: phosphoribulokinase [Methanomicrobiales archaeon]|jgi:phosphoribulokinase|nr:phosphoribulokinase [Methanomicrobiales archaeon]